MLTLIREFLEKLNLSGIAETLRKRKNRLIASRLFLILVQSYEVIELYRILLNELRAALDSHLEHDGAHRFSLNPARVGYLLARQASNLEVLATLTSDLAAELRILDNKLVESWRGIFLDKGSILIDAQHLLLNARLPLSESGSDCFPADSQGEYRTLRFTPIHPAEDTDKTKKYLHGYSGREKVVIDVSLCDGDAFFQEIDRYFREGNPEGRLLEIEELTDRYRRVLLEQFSIEDLLSDIAKVRRHYG
jgi:hypothetical protein